MKSFLSVIAGAWVVPEALEGTVRLRKHNKASRTTSTDSVHRSASNPENNLFPHCPLLSRHCLPVSRQAIPTFCVGRSNLLLRNKSAPQANIIRPPNAGIDRLLRHFVPYLPTDRLAITKGRRTTITGKDSQCYKPVSKLLMVC